MSLVTEAIRSSFAAIQTIYGEPVTFRRGSTDVEINLAVRGRYDATRNDASEGQVFISENETDWLLMASELVDGTTELIPQEGDLIIDADGVEHRALPPGSASQCWKWHGNAPGVAFRIHTKERP